MPALALVTPTELKEVLEADGYAVIHEDAYWWYFARGTTGVPILLPKEPGEQGFVSMEYMADILFKAQISHYKLQMIRDRLSGKGPVH